MVPALATRNRRMVCGNDVRWKGVGHGGSLGPNPKDASTWPAPTPTPSELALALAPAPALIRAGTDKGEGKGKGTGKFTAARTAYVSVHADSRCSYELCGCGVIAV